MILVGDCIASLRTLPEKSAQTCVTSPPYFGLRDYGHDAQIGVEPTPEDFVGKLVEVFREVWRVLADDGTLWLNIGDSYASAVSSNQKNTGYKSKDLIGIPWMLAFALRADGWYLRQDIIWHKPNPMPESVRDRCTKAHEYIFLLSKAERYYFDANAMSEPAAQPDRVRADRFGGKKYVEGVKHSDGSTFTGSTTRNKRSVWTVTTKPFKGAHFATFPPDLIEPCILAGSRPGDVVLDPFGGAGTTGLVSQRHRRKFVLCELNPNYAQMAENRIAAERDLIAETI